MKAGAGLERNNRETLTEDFIVTRRFNALIIHSKTFRVFLGIHIVALIRAEH